MRILQLCHKPPYPAIDGGSIASLNLTKGLLKNGSSVQILAINTYKQYCDPSKVPEDFLKQTQYKLIYVDIKVRLVSAFFNLFSSRSYNMSRFDSQVFRNELKLILNSSKFDIVILESLYTSPYLNTIRALHKGLIVLRSHNVEFKIWENLSKNTKNPFKKCYLTLLSKRLKKYELETLNKVDFIASISASDIEIFKKEGCVTTMKHISFGLNFEEKYFKEYSPPEINELVLFHVGSMDWIPHQEAFKWFFDNVWIEFNHKHPEIKFFLAGSKMPDWLIDNKYKNVLVTNDYVDAKEFSKGKAIMIVPSFSGSGIRIKIAEGMAKGKVIITTTNGAMGIPCSHGENIFIADNPQEWIDILHECATHLAKVQQISLNARTFSLQEFNFVSVAKKLLDSVNFDK